jgi:protein TonB
MEILLLGISTKSIAMETNKILSADILDLIFDERNKDYGAYELRKSYRKRVTKALLITGMMASLIAAGALIARSIQPVSAPEFRHTTVELSSIKEDEPEKLPEPEKKPEVKPVKTIQFTTPIITKEEVVEPPPTVEEKREGMIALTTNPDGEYTGIVDEKVVDDKKGIVEGKKDPESDGPLVDVQIPSKFNGNWENFLKRHLNADVPVDNDAPGGSYQVVIQFVVDKEGNISDIKALTSHGYGMEEEAMRVLRKSPKWEPAIQQGYKVKAYHRQPIRFDVVADE